MKEPRDELVELSGALRAHVERARLRGKTHARVSLEAIEAAQEAAAADPGPVAPAPEGREAAGVPREAAAPKSAARGTAAPKAEAPGPAAEAAVAPPGAKAKRFPRIEIETELPGYEERWTALEALAREASGCTKCGLCKTRTQVVFARGRARNRVMFIGEAPGADEDRLGSPFVGRAGKLLDQIIDAIGFQRDEIYVANILKCRPPRNRDPLPEEIASCTPYLERQIELVEPKIICALGRFAAQFLTGQPKATMGQLRGKIHYYKERIMVLPTYHPAALLRNPGWKRTVWEDVQLLRQEYLR